MAVNQHKTAQESTGKVFANSALLSLLAPTPNALSPPRTRFMLIQCSKFSKFTYSSCRDAYFDSMQPGVLECCCKEDEDRHLEPPTAQTCFVSGTKKHFQIFSSSMRPAPSHCSATSSCTGNSPGCSCCTFVPTLLLHSSSPQS